jgi:hypothetical protein
VGGKNAVLFGVQMMDQADRFAAFSDVWCIFVIIDVQKILSLRPELSETIIEVDHRIGRLTRLTPRIGWLV